jgi:putative membrane protein
VTGREPLLLLIVGAVLLVLSGIGPHDRTTWWLEVAPILIAVPILALTARRFPLTPLAYRLIFVHTLILMLGGHYTYAEVPAGSWVKDALDLARNPYDRLGHFAQGFVPAVVGREVLIRRSPLAPGKWLTFLALSVCLAISALYELVEWWAALILGEGADAFLGTQGDQWDTQWDMFMALLGAATALLVFSRLHDRQITKLEETNHV